MMHLYWVALKSIWAKEIHRFMRIWVQTMVGGRGGVGQRRHAGAASHHHDPLLYYLR